MSNHSVDDTREIKLSFEGMIEKNAQLLWTLENTDLASRKEVLVSLARDIARQLERTQRKVLSHTHDLGR